MKALCEVAGDPHDLLASGRESFVIKKRQICRFDIELCNHIIEPLQGAVIVAKHLGSNSVGLGDQSQKQMFCARIILFVVSGCVLCEADRLLCIFSIVFSH